MSDLFEFNFITYILVLAFILISSYFYFTRNYNYWTSRAVKGPKPLPIFGNVLSLLTKCFNENEMLWYNRYGRIYGIYEGSKPILRVAEPQLIKDINIKDFNAFVDRRSIFLNEPIFDRALTVIGGDDWKQLRSKISPTFSSGKIRKMHALVEQCVRSLENALNNAILKDNRSEVELKKIMGNYTMDVIGLCAFATKIDSHSDPNNPFIRHALKVFSKFPWRVFLFVTAPIISKTFHISIADPEITNFFKSAVNAIISKRSKDKVKGTDFLQLMVDLKNKKSIAEPEDKSNDSESHHANDESNLKYVSKSNYLMTDDDILANSMLFFVAGYETTASLLAFLLYSLALNDECQQKLYLEITSLEGKLNYDNIVQMSYLDACISETLRLYTAVPQTERTAGQDYKLGETGITIEKGTLIQFPIFAIHHDPMFYPNPYRFNPDRFLPENKNLLIPYTYLPFGAGPRNCVGMRLALMEAKTAIVNLVSKFKFVRTSNTKVPLQFCKGQRVLTATDITVGIELR